MRVETDLIGTKEIDQDAYYGLQTLRAYENFNITGRRAHPEFIRSLAAVKKAAAITNCQIGELSEERRDAIVQACDEILAGKLHDAFITDSIQGGAGTSFNMNANEVIANRAIEILGGQKGDYSIVHPNDHVNMAQSTNDVYPSAGKLAILALLPGALHQLNRLYEALEIKAKEFDDVVKMGRTQLQDAVPIRLGQSFHAYASAIQRDIKRLHKASKDMCVVNMGATAIGTAINVSADYLDHIVDDLREVTKFPLIQSEDLIDGTQNLDGFVNVSGIIKTCAVTLSKMSNDLRLMSSGPRTGLAEINLPPKQNGSSIMPGKVNPVIPEVMSQVAFNIIGNDMCITMAAEAGQLELNAFEPVLFYNLFESIETLTGGVRTLIDNCILGITANKEHCLELLEHSVGMITALCPFIGYKRASEIAKESLKTGVPVRKLVVQKGIVSADEVDEILNPFKLTFSEKEREELEQFTKKHQNK